MDTSTPRLVVCYSLGTGAGFDVQLAGLSRQICEDIAEILALHEGFIAIPQMVLVREGDDLAYDVSKNACAFAVFYSLPETQWIADATRAIGGDIALTGRILDDDGALMLSINMLDIQRQVLLFCGYETCPRDEIHLTLCRLCARLLSHFSPRSEEAWLEDVYAMLGTRSFHAYANWMGMRETERKAQREGLSVPNERILEHVAYALVADPAYDRASDKLCEILERQLKRSNYDFIIKTLAHLSLANEAIALCYAQCLARLARRDEARSFLGGAIAKYPASPLFVLMRGCLHTDPKLAANDLAFATAQLKDKFAACRSAVEESLLNVTGV
ncbi:MAG: hypothetical protein FWC40_03645 [Proteobacteria bacterium]|nr:hypothetical protein [Pseudomonadota bacterium]